MKHPLDGARLKVVRAQEHLDAVKYEISMYIHTKPYTVVIEKDGDMWMGRPIVRIEPPPRISTIVGDCVTNARAALDYIAWQLAVRYFAHPPLNPEADKRLISFPIYENTADPGYVNKIKRFADRQIPAAAIDEINSVQPGNTTYRSLAWLHNIVNTDKHRMPVLTYNVTEITSLIVSSPTFRTEAHAEGGSEMLGISLPPAFTAANVQVDGQVTGFVSLKDVPMPIIAPIEWTLEEIIKVVPKVITSFDRFF